MLNLRDLVFSQSDFIDDEIHPSSSSSSFTPNTSSNVNANTTANIHTQSSSSQSFSQSQSQPYSLPHSLPRQQSQSQSFSQSLSQSSSRSLSQSQSQYLSQSQSFSSPSVLPLRSLLSPSSPIYHNYLSNANTPHHYPNTTPNQSNYYKEEDYDDKPTSRNRFRHLNAFWDRKPFPSFRANIRNRPRLPKVYRDSPEVAIFHDSRKLRRDYLPGLSDYLYFPQLDLPSEQADLRRSIARAVWKECLFVGDIMGAMQALEALVQVSIISMIEIEELVNLIRSRGVKSQQTSASSFNMSQSSSSSAMPNDSSSLGMLRQLCDLLMKPQNGMHLETSKSIRSSVLIHFASVYMSDGLVEEAWCVLNRYSNDVCFLTSDQLKDLFAAASVARFIFIVEGMTAAELTRAKTRSQRTRSSSFNQQIERLRDFNGKPIPTAEQVANDSMLLSHVVRFALSRYAAKLFENWKQSRSEHGSSKFLSLSQNINSQTSSHKSTGSRGGVVTLKSIVQELLALLQKTVIRDRQMKLLQLHEYYVALLIGARQPQKAFNHLKLVISRIRNHLKMVESSENSSQSDPLSRGMNAPIGIPGMFVGNEITVCDFENSRRQLRAAEANLWFQYSKYMYRHSNIGLGDWVRRRLSPTEVQALLWRRNSKSNGGLEAGTQAIGDSALVVPKPKECSADDPDLHDFLKALHFDCVLHCHDHGDISTFARSSLAFSLGLVSFRFFLSHTMECIERLSGTNVHFTYEKDLARGRPSDLFDRKPVESSRAVEWRLWKTLVQLLGKVPAVETSAPLAYDSDLHELLFLGYRPGNGSDTTATAQNTHDVSESNSPDSELRKRKWWHKHIFDVSRLGSFVAYVTELEVERTEANIMFANCKHRVCGPDIQANPDRVLGGLSLNWECNLHFVRALHEPDAAAAETFINKNLDKFALFIKHGIELQKSGNSSDQLSAISDSEQKSSLIEPIALISDTAVGSLLDSDDDDTSEFDDESDSSESVCSSTDGEYYGQPIVTRLQDTGRKSLGGQGQPISSLRLLIDSYANQLFGSANNVDDSESVRSSSIISDFYSVPFATKSGTLSSSEYRLCPSLIREDHLVDLSMPSVHKLFYPVFSSSEEWSRSTPKEFFHRRKRSKLVIDSDDHVFMRLDALSLEILTYQVIVAAHVTCATTRQNLPSSAPPSSATLASSTAPTATCSTGVSQDSLFLSRAVQIILLHAILDIYYASEGSIDSSSGSSAASSTTHSDRTLAGLKCLTLLEVHNINIRRAIRIASRAASRDVSVNSPLPVVTLDTNSVQLLSHADTGVYDPV